MRLHSIAGGLALALVGCSSGQTPVHSTVSAGQLPPCPASPNCVSSQAVDPGQQVDPLIYQGTAAAAQARLLAVLNSMERVRIVQSGTDWIQAEFHSAVFGFVDDVTFQFGPPGVIQLRSASRSGYYDFGVNRERVETLRARFAAMPAMP